MDQTYGGTPPDTLQEFEYSNPERDGPAVSEHLTETGGAWTVNGNGLLVPANVLTVMSTLPTGAFAATSRLAVMNVASDNRTSVMVTPRPSVALTVAPEVKLVPRINRAGNREPGDPDD
jgi:hypothetical protein